MVYVTGDTYGPAKLGNRIFDGISQRLGKAHQLNDIAVMQAYVD